MLPLLQKMLRDPVYSARLIADRSRTLMARWSRLHDVRWRMKSRQEVFSEVYDSHAWGSRESGSGTGSELRATGTIRDRLPDLLSRLGAESLLDAPCGDWNWMQHVALPVKRYFGVDIVPAVIERNRTRFQNDERHFAVADLTRDPLPRADVILCRDCLVHVSFQDIALILENFRRTGARWLLLSDYPEIRLNRNQFTGRAWRRLNFRLAPFHFPEPLERLADGGSVDPSRLSLWPLQELPRVRAGARRS
jgi:SAM-dependent methyltransferase